MNKQIKDPTLIEIMKFVHKCKAISQEDKIALYNHFSQDNVKGRTKNNCISLGYTFSWPSTGNSSLFSGSHGKLQGQFKLVQDIDGYFCYNYNNLPQNNNE